MTTIPAIVIAAALASAVLHACWNAAVKASADPQAAMAAQVIGSGMIALPLLAIVPVPSVAALPWLAGSVAFNVLTFLALLRGYAKGGGFGFVYPLARATSPLLVLLLAHTLQGETVSTLGIAGIVLVSCGVTSFACGEGRRNVGALVWALLAGMFSAGYAICDANGARTAPSVLGYGLAVSLVNAAVFGGMHRAHYRVSLLAMLRANWVVASFGACAATLSYFLILWVWSRSPIAIGAALRDTSLVFAALIATRLGEKLTPLRVAAIALVTVGAATLRFA